MSTPVDDTSTNLVLRIGRSVLANQWENEPLFNVANRLEWFNDWPVNTYTSPPFFDGQTAQQLLSTLTHYRGLRLIISLLELGHHHCAAIHDGLTVLLRMASEFRFIVFFLEYERGNPEHNDVYQLITDADRSYSDAFFYWNFLLGADNLLLNEGDVGREMPEDD